MRRRVVPGAVLALLVLRALPACAAPPQVNLLVEMRAVSVVETDAGTVVGTRHPPAAAAGDISLSTRRLAADDTQQVLVLNGGTAALRGSRLLPVPTGRWLWAGSAPGVGQTQQWLDVGRGFEVKPTWPGGAAALTLEISAEAAGAGGALERATVRTRLLLPPGVWTAFASDARTALQVRVRPQP